MDKAALARTLRKRPSVHQLCSGAYLQEPVWLAEHLLLVPLQALGFTAQGDYTAQYTQSVVGAVVDAEAVAAMIREGAEALPTVTIVRFFTVDAPASDLDHIAESELGQARRILSYTSGNEAVPFAVVTSTTTDTFFRLIPPDLTKRQRLGFGNTGVAFHSHTASVFHAMKADKHFEYALSLINDANREANPEFRIARYFNCLECLASSLKAKHGGKTRKAIKDLLGLEDPSMAEACVDGERIRYDPIEIAGRIRDKLFHGIQFREDDLNDQSRPAFRLLKAYPQDIAATIQMYCELEIFRWVNGASKGRLSDRSTSTLSPP